MAGGPTVLSYDDALADATSNSRLQHVLLGNGFSIACRPDCFTYGALLEEAQFSNASLDVRGIFEILGTVDFEYVIESLRRSADLVETYGSTDQPLADRFRADADIVRDALARVLAAKHPSVPFDIAEDQYRSTRVFLSDFERIYTLNYDMLLYWTLMQDIDPRPFRNDGFGSPEDEASPYVVWEPYMDFAGQRVFYLHGGLHLYDSGADLAKITWSRTGIPLVEQIRDALDEGRFPLIVTEGATAAKENAIRHHAYLTHAIRSLARISGSLFTYGWSLAENDDHILQRIDRNRRLRRLYVGLHGDPGSEANRAVASRALRLGSGRNDRNSLTVHFYDVESTQIWGAS